MTSRNPINYVVGDATLPVGDGMRCIVHCCNDVGAWGAGFVVALSKRWSQPEAEFRRWAMPLGDVQFVEVEPALWVANLIGQHGVGMDGYGNPPIRYDAISMGLIHVRRWCRRDDGPPVSVHMPRMGAGLAGGDWRIIEVIIDRELVAHGIPVTVYDLV